MALTPKLLQQGAGGGLAKNYIEDVFSTYLYAGADTTTAINNGINLSGKGGMLWLKARNQATPIVAFDTNRGASPTNSQMLWTASTDYNFPTSSDALNSFNSNGFTLGADDTNWVNTTGVNFASWTFRKQPKFFDVVTYTGDGNYSTDTPSPYGRAISHSLGSRPGFIVIKATSAATDWYVGARKNDTYWIGSQGAASSFSLNKTTAGLDNYYDWATKPMASTTSFFPSNIGAGGSGNTTNNAGVTYVAYLFAHDAGGFGESGNDNVISCGSYTGNGSATGPVINLGYEPQWIMIKNASAVTDWVILDAMRGLVVGGTDRELNPNQSSAESGATYITPTATGFQLNTTNGAYNASGNTFIYIAIRRGPMKVPTLGTTVFGMDTAGGTASGVPPMYRSSFPVDFGWERGVDASVDWYWTPRLLQGTRLSPNSSDAEVASGSRAFDYNNGWNDGTAVNSTYYSWMFKRAPGFMDVVCYTGTSSDPQNYSHNLGVTPELIIIKRRNQNSNFWWVYQSSLTAGNVLSLSSTDAATLNTSIFTTTAPTSSVFKVGGDSGVNSSAGTYVAYLFATCAGVSKVGSYTGTATTKQINCGFTAGARFVLIKRTDSTGDWYLWDSARGIVAGNDPYIQLNNNSPQIINTDYIDSYSPGFELSSTAPAAINANGGNYIFLAIA